MYRLLLIGSLFGLFACQPHYQIHVAGDSIEVVDKVNLANRIDSLVNPYQTELSKEMDIVIAYAAQDFTKSRPNGALNNWAASAVLDHQLRTAQPQIPVISLLNVGGLRNPISMGDVTIGDLYKLMPFDNEVVWVRLPLSTRDKIAAYLESSGGEPIAGAKYEEGDLIFDTQSDSTSFWVITSDYLMNGGDHMDFFEEKLEFHYADILLRDLFIEEAKHQKTLNYSNEERINL